MSRLAATADRLRTSLWFIPALFGAGAFALAALTLLVDQELASARSAFFLFGGTAEGARSVLATIAQSMLTFTALVFTITMLVLQLASSQLSPRVIRTFLRDRGNQTVLGLFIATFLFTLLVLRDVRSPDAGAEFVPALSIFVAFLLLVASVGAFIYYIDHMAHAIRATSVIEDIAAETRQRIDHLFPAAGSAEPARTVAGRHGGAAELASPVAADAVLPARTAGTLVHIDEEGLVRALPDGATVLELVPRVGDYVPEGAPLFRVHGEQVDDDLNERLHKKLTFGSERTLQQDPAYGFRQLVDVGVRALSPGTNDPTTAVEAINRLHDLLRRLAERPFPSAVRLNDDGQPRLIVPTRDWSDYVSLAVDELRISGAGQLQVTRTLRTMLEDLASAAPADRRPIVHERLRELDRTIEDGFES